MKAPSALLVCGLASAALPFLAHGTPAGSLRDDGLAARNPAAHHPHSPARREVDTRGSALLDPLRRRLTALAARGVWPQTPEDEDADDLGNEEDFSQKEDHDDEAAEELKRSLEPRKGGGGGGGRSGGGGGGGTHSSGLSQGEP